MATKTKHAAVPFICEACRDTLLAQVNEESVGGFHYCSHGRAVAIVRVENGTVIEWRILGPLSRERAEATVIRAHTMLTGRTPVWPVEH